MNTPGGEFDRLKLADTYAATRYPFMGAVFARTRAIFGDGWAQEVETLLRRMFPDDDGLRSAIDGYVAFAIESIRLQRRFDREGRYIEKTYEEAASDVYDNPEYMRAVYLPGLVLSHYLWPHHYRQRQFFSNVFAQAVCSSTDQDFIDVGIGTGFYSRLLLQSAPNARGLGFDVSSSSRDFALEQVSRFDVAQRYSVTLQDIVRDPPKERANFVLSIEVLEHLRDPLSFLRVLRDMLKPSGKAFISAAIAAANRDHIFLYRNGQEVLDQLNAAGFKLEQYYITAAYPAKGSETVPLVGSYIVTAA